LDWQAKLHPYSSGGFRVAWATGSNVSIRVGGRIITVTHCGRICPANRKINLSTVFAGQNVGIKQVSDKVWLVSFMQYDLGFFDHETDRVTSAENPFGAKVLPMCRNSSLPM
jgi:hypothetical protein